MTKTSQILCVTWRCKSPAEYLIVWSHPKDWYDMTEPLGTSSWCKKHCVEVFRKKERDNESHASLIVKLSDIK